MSASLIARQSQGLKLVVNTFGDRFCGSSRGRLELVRAGDRYPEAISSGKERSGAEGEFKRIWKDNNLSVCLQAAADVVQRQLRPYFKAR
jgi:hypothetical protein